MNLGFLKEYNLPIVKKDQKRKILEIGIFCVIIKILYQIKN